jgi:hypothetical protein
LSLPWLPSLVMWRRATCSTSTPWSVSEWVSEWVCVCVCVCKWIFLWMVPRAWVGTDNVFEGNGNYAGMIPTVGTPFAMTR